MHVPRSLLHLDLDPSKVALRGDLHLTELTAEGNNGTPQAEQTGVFRVAVVVEGLDKEKRKKNKKMLSELKNIIS